MNAVKTKQNYVVINHFGNQVTENDTKIDV